MHLILAGHTLWGRDPHDDIICERSLEGFERKGRGEGYRRRGKCTRGSLEVKY